MRMHSCRLAVWRLLTLPVCTNHSSGAGRPTSVHGVHTERRGALCSHTAVGFQPRLCGQFVAGFPRMQLWTRGAPKPLPTTDHVRAVSRHTTGSGMRCGAATHVTIIIDKERLKSDYFSISRHAHTGPKSRHGENAVHCTPPHVRDTATMPPAPARQEKCKPRA